MTVLDSMPFCTSRAATFAAFAAAISAAMTTFSTASRSACLDSAVSWLFATSATMVTASAV